MPENPHAVWSSTHSTRLLLSGFSGEGPLEAEPCSNMFEITDNGYMELRIAKTSALETQMVL